MVKAAPAAPFEVAQAEFLFQFLVIAFDDPALFAQRGQSAQPDVFRQVRQPVFARFGFTVRPLDQQPFQLSRLAELVIAMRSTDAWAIPPALAWRIWPSAISNLVSNRTC